MCEKVLKERITLARKAVMKVREDRAIWEDVDEPEALFAYGCVGLLTWIETGELMGILDSDLRRAVEEITSKGWANDKPLNPDP